MRLKRPHVATLDEVTITRNGDEAVIEYADQRIGTTHFRLGPVLQQMTDGDILDRRNACLRGMEQARATYEHVAVEIPPGRPQIRYFERGTSGRRAAMSSDARSTTAVPVANRSSTLTTASCPGAISDDACRLGHADRVRPGRRTG